MNSHVIKFVAGAGKTTRSYRLLCENKRGLYLSYNKKVASELALRGCLAKTFDSFFTTFIIVKFLKTIPLLRNVKEIKYVETERLPTSIKGIGKIKIDSAGKLYNSAKLIPEITMNDIPNKLTFSKKFTNKHLLTYIFNNNNELNLTDELRKELVNYILIKYPKQVLSILSSCFDYIIVDEAQDLREHLLEFSKLIHESCDITTYFLGDEKQNINRGSDWFENLTPTQQIVNYSYRCPDMNCEWIRNNLKFDIYGYTNNINQRRLQIIQYSNVLQLNDGKRVLLYSMKGKDVGPIIADWKGVKMTVKKSKGLTIPNDIVIIGNSMNKKQLYTAITRTTKNVFTTITKINK